MAITNTKSPETLTPVYNPVKFDLTNSTANWVYMNYVLLPYSDNGVNLSAVDFKKSNVYNSTYTYVDYSTTLQDYLTIQNPNLVNRLTPTGEGWIKRFYGVVYDNVDPSYIFIPTQDNAYGQKFIWVFNGVLKRDLFIDYKATDLIANSITGGGKFLTDHPIKSVRYESTAVADVVNGQFEPESKNLINSNEEYTDYHNIKIKNTNSSGLFNNTLLRVKDDPINVRYLTLFVFFGSVNTKFAEGDVISYSTDTDSEVFDYYGSSLDGQYTIQKVEELSISPTTSIYSISVKVDSSIPTTFSLIGNDNMNDIGTITLVNGREWSFYNRYYESSQLDPRAYNLEVPGPINSTSFNKKLTFPTGPVNLRKSMGKRYVLVGSENVGGINYVRLTLDEDHNYEVGDKVIHLPQVFANTSSIVCYGEFNIIKIDNNEITIDLLYSDFPNPNGSGVIWNYIKDGLVKSVKKVVNDVSIRVDPTTNNIEFDLNITARIGVPDKFIITITNYGDMGFTIPSTHLIESIRTYGVLDENSIISFVSRTDVDRMVGYSTTIKNNLKNNIYTGLTIVIHHQIASNKGYSPILGYNGQYTDEYYNNPVNSDVDQYNFELQKIIDSGPPVVLGSESYLTYNLDKRCSKYDLIDVMWLNNYGVYDFYTFNWKKTQSKEYQRNTYRKSAGSFDGTSYNYSNLDRELTDYQITTDTTGILYSDWIKEQEYNRLLEIFDSPIVYIYENGKYTPIVIENDEIEEKTLKNDKIFNISINFRVSFNKKSIRI